MALTFQLLRATVALAADGDIVAAQAGKIIRVHSLILDQLEDAANQSATITSDDASGAVLMQAVEMHPSRPALVLPFSEEGWFETVAGEALFLNITGGSSPLWKVTVSYTLI